MKKRRYFGLIIPFLVFGAQSEAQCCHGGCGDECRPHAYAEASFETESFGEEALLLQGASEPFTAVGRFSHQSCTKADRGAQEDADHRALIHCQTESAAAIAARVSDYSMAGGQGGTHHLCYAEAEATYECRRTSANNE